MTYSQKKRNPLPIGGTTFLISALIAASQLAGIQFSYSQHGHNLLWIIFRHTPTGDSFKRILWLELSIINQYRRKSKRPPSKRKNHHLTMHGRHSFILICCSALRGVVEKWKVNGTFCWIPRNATTRPSLQCNLISSAVLVLLQW